MEKGTTNGEAGAGPARRRKRRGRRGTRGRGGAGGDAFGAIDLGTNNCRLLVARSTPSGFRVVDAFSKVVQLGEGLAGTRTLSEPAMRRTLDALGACAAKLRRRRVKRVRAVATEACRRANNADQFVARVKRETGLELEIIGPAEEARLAIAGCLPLIDRRADRALIFDIGGGSTQIAWIALDADRQGPPKVLGAHSVPLGVVGVSELLDSSTEPARLRAEIEDVLAVSLGRFCAIQNIREEVDAGRVQMIGASGTVTTLGGIAQGLERYDRARVDGAWLDFAAIERISGELAALDPAARAAHPCVGRDRSDLVLAGCLILRAICRQWPIGRLRVADRGLREGILLDLMARASAL
ncbi:Ppx/GppA family phosphatase [Marivibrio halodurans]|uniref:Ppx/GppA family phosphatase n=1 Tax=Marivibrio halodurans TaxID=2039722 RepID=A0A8J7V1E5_9PROT|nr:Ppx/GppA family phosphatase [Marivibrio halodurans]MBP5855747.1 Ppx/GppA family phosphatase [Marivibrio halodurans]